MPHSPDDAETGREGEPGHQAPGPCLTHSRGFLSDEGRRPHGTCLMSIPSRSPNNSARGSPARAADASHLDKPSPHPPPRPSRQWTLPSTEQEGSPQEKLHVLLRQTTPSRANFALKFLSQAERFHLPKNKFVPSASPRVKTTHTHIHVIINNLFQCSKDPNPI